MSGTKQRIVDASLELFNQQGERTVTTNHIAAHLGMSPGNLYYHYRNKEAIIQAIFDGYAEHWQQILSVDFSGGLSLEAALELLDGVFAGLWRYRFFYANLPELLARDDALRERYQTLQQAWESQLGGMLLALRKAGVLEITPEQIPELAQTIKLVISCWIGYRSSLSPDAQITERMIRNGINKVLFILQPWVEPAHRNELASALPGSTAQATDTQTGE